MQYQVLARKWRPQRFDDLVGQPHVARSLLNALKSGRVAHALLFSGPRGSGKTTTARLLAKALNCHEKHPGEPCGKCPACIEIAAGSCMDVIEIDAASNRGIDEIRDLRENVRYHPARDSKKIFIIDEVHMLTTEAFNALLKTLEEPPPHVVFIMATTEHHRIPATIMSRCQHHVFKLIPFDLILERLGQISAEEGFEISRTALEQIVFSSGGSMRDAMSALDQVVAFSGPKVRDEDVRVLLSLVEPAVLAAIVRSIAANNVEGILKSVADLEDAGQDLQNVCRRLLAHFRNLMVIKSGVTQTALLGIPESLLPDLKEQAGLFSQEDLLRLFDTLARLEPELRHSTQTRFHFEMGLIELSQLSRLRPLEAVISDLQSRLRSEPADLERAAAAVPDPPEHPDRVPSSPRPHSPGRSPGRRVPPGGGPAAAGQGEAPPLASRLADTAAASPSEDPRRLLLEIAAAVQKQSLEPIIQTLGGARIEGKSVILEMGDANDFQHRQLRDNLEAVTAAAARVIGNSDIRVVFEAGAPEISRPRPTADPPGPRSEPSEDLLERAKKEPVVRSFLEVFPGPVKVDREDT